MPTIADTRFQMVQFVFPEHINQRGNLYGGRMMSWIATAGTLAASRVARGPVVLGAMDDLDFLTPIHLGEIVTMEAQVEFIGRSSLEVGVTVDAELPQHGVPRRATSSHLAPPWGEGAAQPGAGGAGRGDETAAEGAEAW